MKKKTSEERPTPPRAPHRLEGVVKNLGIKEKKKEKKKQKNISL